MSSTIPPAHHHPAPSPLQATRVCSAVTAGATSDKFWAAFPHGRITLMGGDEAITTTVDGNTSPIQSIVAFDNDGGRFAAVDGVGRIHIGGGGKENTIPMKCSEPKPFMARTGWYGLAPSHHQKTHLLCSGTFSVMGSTFVDCERDVVLSTIPHEFPVIAVCPVPTMSDQVFICAEWADIVVLDVRKKSKLVERISSVQMTGGGEGPLWALSGEVANDGFAIGGESKTVTLLDPRRWRSRGVWKTPLKYDVVGLCSHKTDDGKLITVALGLDHEITNFTWLQPRPVTEVAKLDLNYAATRTRANWLGITLSQSGSNTNVVACDAEGSVHRM